jgi:hypothetical protein
MVEIKLNANVSVHVWPEHQFLQSVFKTAVLPAAPNWGHPPSVRLAHELGYNGDCYLMSRDHEILHHVIASHRGAPWSWTLWWEAHKDEHRLPKPPLGLYSEEEGLTLALQRLLKRGDAAERDGALNIICDLDLLVAKARATLLPFDDLREPDQVG